jgi:hypothetical protein
MRLSVLMPTHRVGLSACSRILEVCSWASEDVEVIVRDNSGDNAKRSLLGQIQLDTNCRIIIVDEDSPHENFISLMEAAQGDFVFFLADDDLCARRAIDAVVVAIQRFGDDQSVVGVTGQYLFETTEGSQMMGYGQIGSVSAIQRLEGYFALGLNLLFYSAVRRTTWLALWNWTKALPFRFSYIDLILAVIALLSGRYVDIKRLIYIYDFTGWEGGLKFEKDYEFYRAAGIDRSILWLHGLFCAFEGTKIILSDLFAKNLTTSERMAAATIWYQRVLGSSVPLQTQTPLEVYAEQLRSKWLRNQQVDLDAMLHDLSEFLTLATEDKAKALRYRAYWSAIRLAPGLEPTRPA